MENTENVNISSQKLAAHASLLRWIRFSFSLSFSNSSYLVRENSFEISLHCAYIQLKIYNISISFCRFIDTILITFVNSTVSTRNHILNELSLSIEICKTILPNDFTEKMFIFFWGMLNKIGHQFRVKCMECVQKLMIDSLRHTHLLRFVCSYLSVHYG